MDSVAWLFVDLNSYFASVEQELRPELRGKPVAVVPVKAETTCCIAASYEAKAFGVKTGTMVYEARRRCPGIQFVEARHGPYVEYHHRIVAAVESCLPVTAVMSIDEMACRLRGPDQEISMARALVQEIKQKILCVGSQLRCSVGLAPNRFLAKVASDMQKPDGLVVVQKKDLPQILYRLKLRDFPGIGENMERRLHAQRITTTQQLLNLDAREMRKIWGGIGGERFHAWLRGEDLEISVGKNKSLGHSHILPPELRSEEGAYAVGMKLLHKAATRLRRISYWASAMSLSIRYMDRTHWAQTVKMLECQDTITLTEVFKNLWAERAGGIPIKVSVTLFDLIADQDRTYSFFDDRRRQAVSRAMDAVNVKYGKTTVYFGGVHVAKVAAPTRIAFASIPEFSLEH